MLIASTRDHLYNMDIADALRQTDYPTIATMQMDKHDSLALAVGVNVNDTFQITSNCYNMRVKSYWILKSQFCKLLI
jgi:hypothetical protein